MISILNRYMHGYVVIPITIAFIKHGIFKKLSTLTSLPEIISRTRVNSGNFKIAMKMYESLGWIERVTNDHCEISPTCPDFSNINSSLALSYQIPLERYLRLKNDAVNTFLDDLDFSKLIKLIPECRSEKTDYLSYLLSSVVLLPLLYLLKHKTIDRGQELCLDGISNLFKKEVCNFFYKTGMTNGTKGRIIFSELGHALWESIKNTGVTLSYRPILAEIDKLIFGDAKAVFSNFEVEEHVDRGLNVIGCGAQHGLFFQDMIEYIHNFLEKENFEEVHLVDMGCGDGTFIRKCYEFLDPHIKKSKKIDLIGVDLNEEALDVAKKTLKNIPHFLLKGNIDNPQLVLAKLLKKGFRKENLLHTRAFLDHNCPLGSNDILCTINNDEHPVQGTISTHNGGSYPEDGNTCEYSDCGAYANDIGVEIPGEVIGKNLVKIFEKWAQIIDEKGLVTLEVFCLSPATIKKYLDETESLHFDTLHGLSKQYLVSAHVYLTSAAKAGLIPTKSSFKKYPRVLPYTRISLQHFFKRPFQIRYARSADLIALYELEKATLPPNLRATKEQINTRITQVPNGNYIVEKDARITGVLYTQRIEKESLIYQMSYEFVEKYHRNEGKLCQLLSVQIDPLEQGGGLARELLSFVILHNFVREGVKKVVGISRCACYHSSKGDYAGYIHGKNKLGYALDPILRLHQEEGAMIIDVVENYRKNDHQNLGFGVHIAYDYLSWSQKE